VTLDEVTPCTHERGGVVHPGCPEGCHEPKEQGQEGYDEEYCGNDTDYGSTLTHLDLLVKALV